MWQRHAEISELTSIRFVALNNDGRETQTATSNPTPNFQIIADNEAGLLFKNKRDRKVINVDPMENPGDNSRRVEVPTHEYSQVVLWDHVTRRKN